MGSPEDSSQEKQEGSGSGEPAENRPTPLSIQDGASGGGPVENEPSDTSNTVVPDAESLHPVSSGPVYSAFSKPTKRWIIAMAACSSFVSPMTANIYFPALNPIADDLG